MLATPSSKHKPLSEIEAEELAREDDGPSTLDCYSNASVDYNAFKAYKRAAIDDGWTCRQRTPDEPRADNALLAKHGFLMTIVTRRYDIDRLKSHGEIRNHRYRLKLSIWGPDKLIVFPHDKVARQDGIYASDIKYDMLGLMCSLIRCRYCGDYPVLTVGGVPNDYGRRCRSCVDEANRLARRQSC